MHGLIRPEQAPVHTYINPLIHFPFEQKDFIDVEFLQVEALDLENEVNDFITILDYINKINSGWFSSCLTIQNEKIMNWLTSDLESYRFYREFSEYLTQISGSYGIILNEVELEPAKYEYPQEGLDEIVIILKINDSIESDEFMKLWNHLSQESYNFIKNEGEFFENLFNRSILVLRREGDDE